MELKGSRTEKNLLTAFIGESQARNKYTYFAGVANKEGLVQISKVFEETANHEKEHAKRLFKFLTECTPIQIDATFSAGKIGTTIENLYDAASGEKHEVEHMYPEFAAIAREEGFEAIAKIMEAIVKAEDYHRRRYEKFIKELETKSSFKSGKTVIWKCNNCGHLHEGPEAPLACPACAHPQAYFEILNSTDDL
ncbi:MAG: rubrerythrin family protein [Rickettsiales bacterium]|jgi:rubrerythrin|nr:rubrerythrin family protein [Rickettsiales bacterium]